ncbi:putative tailspike protein [Serratia phage vB_SmaS_Opt-148]|nr:putative tailspike protein [Serratia phage vB_SmaS_Opt-148]
MIKLKGILRDASENPIPDVRIILRSVKNGDVPTGVETVIISGKDGSYETEISTGSYICYLMIDDKETAMPGYVNIYKYSGTGTLQEYLYAPCEIDARPMFLYMIDLALQQMRILVESKEEIRGYYIRAEDAASRAEAAIAASGKIYTSIEQGIAGTSSGDSFIVSFSEQNDEYKDIALGVYNNKDGSAEFVTSIYSKVVIDRIISMISKRNGNELSSGISSDGKPYFVFAPNGGLMLRGINGFIQDIDTVKNPEKYKKLAGVVDIVDESTLSENIDSEGKGYSLFAPNGGLMLRGLASSVQESIKTIANRVNAIDGGVTPPKSVENKVIPIYAIDDNGGMYSASVTFSAAVDNVTEPSHMSSWPQGKMRKNSKGVIYQGYNNTTSHGGSGMIPRIKYSEDNGKTWSDGYTVDVIPGKARGTDHWAIGVDGSDNLYSIVRARGATNKLGDTDHRLYKSTDSGKSWSYVKSLNYVTQKIGADDFVPELYHDMLYFDGYFYTGYHFANSSRLGVLKFNPLSPDTDYQEYEFIAHGEMSTTTLVEINIDYDPFARKFYGGIGTQSDSVPARLFYVNTDMSSLKMFDAPYSVKFNVMAVKRCGDYVYYTTIERFNTGEMKVFATYKNNYYSGDNTKFFSFNIGKIISKKPSGASNVGVQSMVEVNGDLLLSFGTQDNNDNSLVYVAKIGINNNENQITYSDIEV